MFILFCLFFSALPLTASAQMTLPSVFPDLKSVNPAVIGLRKQGQLKLSATKDTIERTQKIDNLNGNPFEAEQKDKTDLMNVNFFRGGKGGGITSEFIMDYTTGDQKTDFESSNESTDFTINSKAMYAKYALGLRSRLGIELHYVSFNSDHSYQVNLDGQSFSDNIEMQTAISGVKLGKIMGRPNLSLGLTAEVNSVSSKFESNDPLLSGDDTDLETILGIGVGTGGPRGLLEISLEVDPFSEREEDPSTGERPPMPMKASLIAERRFGKLILGYKGMLFKGQFTDLDKIIPSQLVYKDLGDSSRLEHEFNFTLAGTRGLSFGVSAIISNTGSQEKSSIFSTENKHDTETSAMSLGVRIGYVY